MTEGILVHSCSYTAGLSSNSHVTNVWFFSDLNIVCTETIYDHDRANNHTLHCHGGTAEKRDVVMAFLRAKREKDRR